MMIEELLEMMKNAKDEPSENCIDRKNHEFKAVSHSDGRESFTWYFQCEHCKEMIKQTTKRTGVNKELWDE